jgi:hypothetical protein
MPLRHWATYALALILAAASMIAFLQMRKLSASEALRLSARIEMQRLHLRWDPGAAPKSATSSAFLVVDGERRNLSESEFLKGSLELPFTSFGRDLELRLQAGAIEDSLQIVHGLR